MIFECETTAVASDVVEGECRGTVPPNDIRTRGNGETVAFQYTIRPPPWIF